MKHRKAIVTLGIGKGYASRWKSYCESNWRAYAEKHDYDLIFIASPLDNSSRADSRSPAWQKCLILGHDSVKKYERVVWVDADVIVNVPMAPDIAEGVPLDKVGAVEMFSTPSQQQCEQALERLLKIWGDSSTVYHNAHQYYLTYGLLPTFNRVVQTGVMVLAPPFHRDILEHTYFKYEDKGHAKWHYEMRPLSYELVKADLVHWIDSRFNILWADQKVLHYPFLLNEPSRDGGIKKYLSLFQSSARLKLKKVCIAAAFSNSYFLHFAGCSQDMLRIDLEGSSL